MAGSRQRNTPDVLRLQQALLFGWTKGSSLSPDHWHWPLHCALAEESEWPGRWAA